MKWVYEIYEKIESRMHPEEFESICLSPDNYHKLNWIHDREFVKENKWFDVVEKTRFEDGFCFLLVYPDVGEKELFAFLDISGDKLPIQDSHRQVHDIFKSLFHQNLILPFKNLYYTIQRFLDHLLCDGTDHSITRYPPPRHSS